MGVWRCVKCGAGGTCPAEDLVPAAPGARSRWKKFMSLVRCTECGDDRGHAGVIEFLPGESLSSSSVGQIPAPWRRWRRTEGSGEDPRLPPGPAAAARAAASLACLIDRLGGERAARALMAWRGLPEPLAWAIAARGVAQIGEVDAGWIRRHLPDDLSAVLRPLIDHRDGLLIPVQWFLPETGILHLAAVQVRYRHGEPRYRTGRLFRDWSPPAALLLPGGGPPLSGEDAPWPFRDRNSIRIAPRVVITEGWFKAAVAAEVLEVPAVGFLGLPRRTEETARHLRAVGIREAWLAPDFDLPPNPGVGRAFRRMARALRAVGIRAAWLRWPAGTGKGIDDALLAGWRPDFIRLSEQANKFPERFGYALQAS